MGFVGTRVFVIAAAIFACVAGRPCRASDDSNLSLYQAMEIVTGTDMRERPRGFAMCLADVLVKVSGGPRLRSDPRVVEMEKHANEYVLSFSYVDPIAAIRHHDDQGTYDRSQNLTVTFDPAKIDALLTSLGQRPWRGQRPVLIPVLFVRSRHPPAYLLSATEDLAAEQRAAFERVASEAGISWRFATAAEFGNWGVGEDSETDGAACGPQGEIVVRGTLDWSDAAQGWVGKWRACWKGGEHAWAIRGVGYDEAFANIVEGAALIAAGRGEPEKLTAALPEGK